MVVRSHYKILCASLAWSCIASNALLWSNLLLDMILLVRRSNLASKALKSLYISIVSASA